jgi:hypothetical protein
LAQVQINVLHFLLYDIYGLEVPVLGSQEDRLSWLKVYLGNLIILEDMLTRDPVKRKRLKDEKVTCVCTQEEITIIIGPKS